ncbi:sensor histidine kinase [Amycolatopsis sp.]|jgi:signal transduction histidine kinase|uniref:sensor histidine kinase n=1 Tax=Amycolatopsis sp. TaxID=37632 RepID=UPI002DFA6450|nr:histidine kinase [Amycolatopsis sp.]
MPETMIRWLRETAGLALGAATAFAELAYVLLGGLALLVPAARPRVFAGALTLSELERRRLERWLSSGNATDYTGRRAFDYLTVRCVVGLLGAGILLLIGYGAVTGVIIGVQVASGQPAGGGGEPMEWYDPIGIALFGVLLVFLCLQGLSSVATLDRKLAQRFLGPSPQELLRRRVTALSVSRAEMVEAVNDERRRIERDLHDGVQQRLVALGMLLGRARRTNDVDHSANLLRQAHEAAQEALQDLREVTWRVYPIALDEGGLHTALEALAERSNVPVVLRYGLAARPEVAVETVAYFVASEAVTNTIKHAQASSLTIDVELASGSVVIRISDDGTGGAQLSGGGLSGLSRRVAAADGEFTVDSPPGGPTTVTAVLPCA